MDAKHVSKLNKKMRSCRVNLLIYIIAIIIVHVVINIIQSSLEDPESFFGWNIIRTTAFIIIAIVFYIKWRQLSKYETKLINTLKAQQ